MNRRAILTMLGLAPVAVATGAVAAKGRVEGPYKFGDGELSIANANLGAYATPYKGRLRMKAGQLDDEAIIDFNDGKLTISAQQFVVNNPA